MKGVARIRTEVQHSSVTQTRPWRGGIVVLSAWTLFGLAQTVLASFMGDGHFTAEYMMRSMTQFMPRVFAWAAFTPVIAFADAWIRRRSPSVIARIGLHIPLYLVCAMLQAVIRRTMLQFIEIPVMVPFYVTVFYFADIEAVRYVASLMLGRLLEATSDLAKRERRAAQLREELAQAQLHYLDLQLQPHFLFNALGSIAELAHEAPNAAAKMVDHLKSLLRYATERRTRQEVTLREELEALHPYLEIQRMRFPDWLEIVEQIEPRAYDAMVPRMLLQPLVENAIRHGLSHRKRGGLIEFRASVHGYDLIISVSDNGVGLQSGSSSRGLGIGLTNIRERLATLYQEQHSIELISHDEGGVEVLLRIPFRRVSDMEAVEAVENELATSEFPVPEPEPAQVSNVRRLAYGWIVATIALTMLSLAYVYVRHPLDHEPALEIIRRHVIHVIVWLALTPIVVYVAKRIPFSRANLIFTVPLHVVLGSIVSIGHVAASRILVGGEQPALLSGVFMDSIYWNLAAYGILVAFAQRTAIEAWIRERDVAAARLKAELKTAQLSAVMLELKPEFLLSSLDTLRSLVLEDATKAETLLTSLADFLRTTLEARAVPAHAMRNISEQIARAPVQVA
jgi:sensor histidine kinase YesM